RGRTRTTPRIRSRPARTVSRTANLTAVTPRRTRPSVSPSRTPARSSTSAPSTPRWSAFRSWCGELARQVGGAEHAEVGRRLVRQELAVPAVAERAVQHQHLPERVDLRGVEHRVVDLQQGREAILRYQLDH